MGHKVHVARMSKAEYDRLRQEFSRDAPVLDARVQFWGKKAFIFITPELQRQVTNELLDKLFWFANNIKEEQFLSYFYQVHGILNLPYSQAKSILEVGPGRGIFQSMIQNFGYDVTTLDLIPTSGPDVTGNVLSLPFRTDSFDVVVCFEVLEHLPYRYFRCAIAQMASVARNYMFLSLPYQCNAVLLDFRLKMVQRFFHRFSGKYHFFLPIRALRKDIDEQAQLQREDKHNPHYWEIGRKSFPERRILADVEAAGVTVVRRFHSPYHPYHFYILCKMK